LELSSMAQLLDGIQRHVCWLWACVQLQP